MVIIFACALVVIESFLKVVSVLVKASPPDDHFHKVWIILKVVSPGEFKRRFEIDVVKVDWIISIKLSFDRKSSDCGVLSLLQLD